MSEVGRKLTEEELKRVRTTFNRRGERIWDDEGNMIPCAEARFYMDPGAIVVGHREVTKEELQKVEEYKKRHPEMFKKKQSE